MSAEPEQWAVELAKYVPRPTRLMAAFAIQRAFEERERKLREAVEDKAWIEARELVRGTNADLCKDGSGQTYRFIIERLTDAIHNRSLRTFSGRVEHCRARQALKDTTHD